MTKFEELTRIHVKPPANVWEVGVFNVRYCMVNSFINDPSKQWSVTLVDALPDAITALVAAYHGKARIINALITDVPGPHEFLIPDRRDETIRASSFIAGLKSPFNAITPQYRDTLRPVTMIGTRFNVIDDGKIDSLLVDVESSDWFVLKHMVSRPKVIRIELGASGPKHIHPFKKEIMKWMEDNGYELKAEDGSGPDGIFVRA